MISKEDRDKILEFCKEKQWRTYLHEVYLIDGLGLEDFLTALTAEDDNQIAKRVIEKYIRDTGLIDPNNESHCYINIEHCMNWLDRRD